MRPLNVISQLENIRERVLHFQTVRQFYGGDTSKENDLCESKQSGGTVKKGDLG